MFNFCLLFVHPECTSPVLFYTPCNSSKYHQLTKYLGLVSSFDVLRSVADQQWQDCLLCFLFLMCTRCEPDCVPRTLWTCYPLLIVEVPLISRTLSWRDQRSEFFRRLMMTRTPRISIWCNPKRPLWRMVSPSWSSLQSDNEADIAVSTNEKPSHSLFPTKLVMFLSQFHPIVSFHKSHGKWFRLHDTSPQDVHPMI